MTYSELQIGDLLFWNSTDPNLSGYAGTDRKIDYLITRRWRERPDPSRQFPKMVLTLLCLQDSQRPARKDMIVSLSVDSTHSVSAAFHVIRNGQLIDEDRDG